MLRFLRMVMIVTLLFIPYTSALAQSEDFKEKLRPLLDEWTIQALVKGDLNGDGTADVTVVISEDAEAALRVYFFDEHGTPTLATEAPGAVCVACGGLKGGWFPFHIEIDRKVLSITYSGGSRSTYSVTTKWRYQNRDFHLIGVTSEAEDTIAEKGEVRRIVRDANVSTLTMTETAEIVTESTDDRYATEKRPQITCKVPDSYRGMRLSQHSLEQFRSPVCSKISSESIS